MNYHEAQNDLRQAYTSGATGVMVSGLVWLCAGFVAIISSFQSSILFFFVGGMFIFPLGMALSRMVFNAKPTKKGNKLSTLAGLSTVLIFIGLYFAYFVSNTEEHFYPIMMIAIGIRYFIFQSVYGLRIYWALASFLCLFGVFFTLGMMIPSHAGALIGGGIEVLFSVFLLRNYKREMITLQS